MLGEFQYKRYTVSRLNNQQVQVKAKNAPTRFLYVGVAETGKGINCTCPKYGNCGHAEAAKEFVQAEAKQSTQPQVDSLDALFAW